MTRTTALALCLGFCLWAAGPSAAEGPPPADAAALWTYITQTSPYRNWPQWPDFAGVQQSRSPHGPLVKVFVNDSGSAMARPPAPYGMIQVKEGYSADKKLDNITVMYKARGYNPDGGDWFWAKYTPQGRATAAGKPRGCLACHGARADNDYILAHFFK